MEKIKSPADQGQYPTEPMPFFSRSAQRVFWNGTLGIISRADQGQLSRRSALSGSKLSPILNPKVTTKILILKKTNAEFPRATLFILSWTD